MFPFKKKKITDLKLLNGSVFVTFSKRSLISHNICTEFSNLGIEIVIFEICGWTIMPMA